MTSEQNSGRAMRTESDMDLANRLMRFYQAESLYQLIRMQDQHIERLQTKLPRPALGDHAINRVREG